MKLVLMAGGTASGKSTIARAFCERTGARLIPHDRYYWDVPDPRVHNYDHPAALDTALLVEHLETLLAGRAAQLPVYDFKTHTRQPHTETVEPSDVVVVEGILVLAHDELRSLGHHRVFVECPDDVRLARRIQRDRALRGRSVDDILRQYFETVRPMHERHVAPSREHAEVLLDGTERLERSVEALIQRIVQG